MKKIYLPLFTLGLLVALISMPGCESKNIQTVTTTESPPNAIYTAAAATLSFQSTDAADHYPNAFYTAEAATFSAQLTEAALRNPSTTPFRSLTPTPVTPSPTITPTPYNAPKWEISPTGSNFALIVLDYETLKFKAAYFEVFEPCSIYGPFKSDEDLVSRAVNALKRTGPKPGLQHVGDFALFEIYPGDIGGVAVLDPCTGHLLFAGIIAMGGGDQTYPVHPIVPDAFKYETGQIRQPQRIDAITSPESTNV